MASTEDANARSEEWRALLLGTDPRFARWRRVLKHLPAAPRCKMCAAPFRGPFTGLMGRLGRAPWEKNPKYCGLCEHLLQVAHGGAEIECTLLFADVRGSTTLAEAMRPAEFSQLMERFFRTASDTLIEHDAIVDKFVGDAVVALFIPALTQEAHAARAIEAAAGLLHATGHDEPEGPWVPVGAGVASGTAFVGSVGAGANAEITALGDVVNTAALLAAVARAGEVLVTARSAQTAGVARGGHALRRLELKGKSEPVDVIVLGTAIDGR